MKKHLLKTEFGSLCGLEAEEAFIYLGIPYARADRFYYAWPVDTWKEELDATEFGPACPQFRQFFPQLDNPERLFYHREFREGMTFVYDEDCLNLNIYAPKDAKDCPVIVFFYGGGFNSGSNREQPFRGEEFAKRGIVTVFANYRVGIFGYMTHEGIEGELRRDGNFGLDDQRVAVRWVKKHIAAFGGDPENITLMGQSAGAISIQYLCLDHGNEGLFRRAIMMSGGGMFPKFALPRRAEKTREFWLQLMEVAGCRTLDELRALDVQSVLEAQQQMKSLRKDVTYNTMPVVDGYQLPDRVDRLIRHPLDVDYMIGFTNNDMYAPVMAHIGTKFGRANGAYLYYFDIDAPGDGNAAFHSSDLRYMFGQLSGSWRPYGERDYEASGQMMDYVANFARCGDPNGEGLPEWRHADRWHSAALCIRPEGTKMGHPSYLKMTRNMISKGNPKAGR
ncbi:MAG: carboxylesterase family protein [Lachnospiraceae bacterium]|nr:carboxylesterase family protein [Lachnospiraceae bacterium]